MGQSGGSAGLQAHRSGGVQNCPEARPDSAVRRVMSLLLRESRRQKSKALLSAPLGNQRHLSGERGCRTAGCERGPMPAQVATRTPGGRKPYCCDYSENRCRGTGIGLSACADSEVALGELRLRGSQASLNSNCQKNRRKQFSSPTARHIACNVVVNAFQQYEWLARLATAKLQRRSPILELAHPPLRENGANSLEIHATHLLKSSASRQEKASACNRNCAAANEHFGYGVVLDRRADVNAAGS
jgi:hypothetical protein